MKALMNNVQLLKVKNIHNSILSFLNIVGDKSQDTKKAYEKDIINFFSVMRGKNLNELTVDDLTYDRDDIIRYRTYVKELKKKDGSLKYKASSINRFIRSVRSLLKDLEQNGYREYINLSAFNFVELPEKDSERAGILSEAEFELFENTALQLENGAMKSILFGLAGRTSFRISALLSLTWADLTPIAHGAYKGEGWNMRTIDKGNKEDIKPIMNVFYERMVAMKNDEQYNIALERWRDNERKNAQKENRPVQEDVIFPISSTAVDNAVKRICKLTGIGKERKVSIHSFKGFGINKVVDAGGTSFQAQDQANHSSIKTTEKHYLSRRKEYSMYAGMLIDEEIDINILNNLNKMELLKIINDMDKGIQRQIVNKAKQCKLV
ncbi:tyrosine-type recombinase/integrase [Paenibacillus odorifer]|uniref:tyrosine-type recombinase/integrase n=1 Tax=Paenibacillus odorifer TaxID=189426 RepID=UPI00096DF381|nr:tyrosine-type recombinase/integrase [Paenibacillus odorifer]OME41428.1 hypothetical protein BSK58_14955 [Paenibacillus odorifer]